MYFDMREHIHWPLKKVLYLFKFYNDLYMKLTLSLHKLYPHIFINTKSIWKIRVNHCLCAKFSKVRVSIRQLTDILQWYRKMVLLIEVSVLLTFVNA